MRRADEQANDRLREGATADTCTGDCDENENPCKHLERGSGTGPYRGGAHGQTKLPYGDGLESHHTPAASASPLPYDKGPAIQMEPVDHTRTRSHSWVRGSRAYQAQQREMIASGQFMGAIMQDYADVQRIAIEAGQPGKYDEALTEMLAYAECLKRTGQVQ